MAGIRGRIQNMRADRLLSILMILQHRGRVTADELAEELEVSVRTIYRDITALSTAGVPVYCERGPGGGISLVESYRTDLTGLNPDESRALFMLSIPTPLDEIGFGNELKTAMHKLAAALPSSRREDQRSSTQRIHLDWQPWFHEQEAQPHLQTIQQAVWEDRQLDLKYYSESGQWLGVLEATVTPLGLVGKTGRWYLVASREDHIVVIRTSWVIEAAIRAETFTRPDDFDLAKFWHTWRTEYEARKPHYPVQVHVSPQLLKYLPHHFGKGIQSEIDRLDPPDDSGWYAMTLPFESLEDARDKLLALGGAVEVLEPWALRMTIIDYAEQIEKLYGK